MSEKTLWQWLKGKTAGWHIVRIESATLLGIPDVNYCAETGMEGWVELKYAERWPPSGKPPFALASQHKLTPQQEFFISTRAEHGSCSGILCQVGSDRYFIPGSYAHEFNQMTKERMEQVDILELWLKEGYHATATA